MCCTANAALLILFLFLLFLSIYLCCYFFSCTVATKCWSIVGRVDMLLSAQCSMCACEKMFMKIIQIIGRNSFSSLFFQFTDKYKYTHKEQWIKSMRNESVWLAGRSVGWSEISLKKSEIDHKKIKTEEIIFISIAIALDECALLDETSVCNVMCSPPHTTSLDAIADL